MEKVKAVRSLRIDVVRKRTVTVVKYLVLGVLGAIFALPFIWLVLSSLKSMNQLMKYPPDWIPNPVLWSNYLKALTYAPFLEVYFKNTAFYCGLCVAGVLLSNSLIAYGFSRIKWPGRDVVFILVLSTMMVPWFVTQVPLYILFRSYGWIGTFRPLIIPAFFGSPFYIFLLRQFYKGIPSDLSDAARIDGCSELNIFARIILPLSKSGLAVVALFELMWRWNDFAGPLIYLTDSEKYTIAIGLQTFLGDYRAEWGLLMAASAVTITPILLVFFFTQRTFIQGITFTGLKV